MYGQKRMMKYEPLLMLSVKFDPLFCFLSNWISSLCSSFSYLLDVFFATYPVLLLLLESVHFQYLLSPQHKVANEQTTTKNCNPMKQNIRRCRRRYWAANVTDTCSKQCATLNGYVFTSDLHTHTYYMARATQETKIKLILITIGLKFLLK